MKITKTFFLSRSVISPPKCSKALVLSHPQQTLQQTALPTTTLNSHQQTIPVRTTPTLTTITTWIPLGLTRLLCRGLPGTRMAGASPIQGSPVPGALALFPGARESRDCRCWQCRTWMLNRTVEHMRSIRSKTGLLWRWRYNPGLPVLTVQIQWTKQPSASSLRKDCFEEGYVYSKWNCDCLWTHEHICETVISLL